MKLVLYEDDAVGNIVKKVRSWDLDEAPVPQVVQDIYDYDVSRQAGETSPAPSTGQAHFTLHFATTADRDQWLDQFAGDREFADVNVPGVFMAKLACTIGVHLLDVTIHLDTNYQPKPKYPVELLRVKEMGHTMRVMDYGPDHETAQCGWAYRYACEVCPEGDEDKPDVEWVTCATGPTGPVAEFKTEEAALAFARAAAALSVFYNFGTGSTDTDDEVREQTFWDLLSACAKQ